MPRISLPDPDEIQRSKTVTSSTLPRADFLGDWLIGNLADVQIAAKAGNAEARNVLKALKTLNTFIQRYVETRGQS